MRMIIWVFSEFLSWVCPLPEDITREQAEAMALAEVRRDDGSW